MEHHEFYEDYEKQPDGTYKVRRPVTHTDGILTRYGKKLSAVLAEIKGKTDGLAKVAITGSYNDLEDKPTLIKGDMGQQGVKGDRGLTATIVIAASDSGSRRKDAADYVCTGTDDQVVMLNAINGLPVTGGKIVFVEGNYNVTNAIKIDRSNVVLEGMGNATTINATGTMVTLFEINGFDCAVQHMCLNENTLSPSVLVHATGSNVLIQNNKFNLTYKASGESTGILISGSAVANSRVCSNYFKGSGLGIHLTNCKNIVVSSNTFYTKTAMICSNCYIISINGNTATISGNGFLVKNNSRSISICGNTIDGELQGYDGIRLENVFMSTVIGNICNDSQDIYIRLSGCDRCIVHGNTAYRIDSEYTENNLINGNFEV